MTSGTLEEFVNDNFLNLYIQYRGFKEKVEYKKYWDLCIKAINDEKFLEGVIFCNDVLNIPPVKVFLKHYKKELIGITRNTHALLPLYINRGFGAFWATIFRFALGYQHQEAIRINESLYFNVRTASYYYK